MLIVKKSKQKLPCVELSPFEAVEGDPSRTKNANLGFVSEIRYA